MIRTGKRISQKKRHPQLGGRRSVKFPGLLNDAAVLGVRRDTLYNALSGLRKTAMHRELVKRYDDLKAEQKKEVKLPERIGLLV